VFSHAGGDVAPQLSAAEGAPESLVLEPLDPEIGPDVSDVDDFSTALDGVLTTSNPASGPEVGDLYRLDVDLVQTASFETGVFELQNAALDRQGDAFVTFNAIASAFEGGSAGGFLVLNRLAKGRDGETAAVARDRGITGASTLMVEPRGIDVVDSLGRVLVAESNGAAPSVLVFSSTTVGDATPLQVTDLPAPPWDLDYDPASDILFVALTDGSIAVYDAYFTLPVPTTPDRVITISDGAGLQESVNLHGIVYDAVNDSLIVSDVGVVGDTTDGVIYTVSTAATADGLVDPTVRIAGATTTLGDPVDLAYNGRDLFVAENANGMILRFNDVLTSAGGDLAPSDSAAQVAPESVCLIPSDLSPASGGSIF
jgi:hypothetical protein